MEYDLIPIDALVGANNLQPLSWVMVLAFICSAFLAASMGSNDVANAFGTSVGAGVLTVKQACIVAAILTFGGAVSLGASVTKTIAGKVVHVNDFETTPGSFMIGMWCASLSAASCVALATKFRLPVSTTHAIVGSIIGFALVDGQSSVEWWPTVGGIAISWVSSPLCAGVISMILYLITRTFVLQASNIEVASRRQRVWVSIVIGMTIALAVIFIGFKEAPATTLWNYLIPFISGIVWLIFSIISYHYVLPKIFQTRHMTPQSDVASLAWQRNSGFQSEESSHESKFDIEDEDENDDNDDDDDDDDDRIEIIITSSNKNKMIEDNFKVVQIMTACYMSFSHGAGDIANAAGPLLAIWSTYDAGQVLTEIDTNYWIITISGLAVVAGLVLFGHHVIQTVGTEITEITPSRGFCVELGTAIAVLIASFIGMPISTTHCAVGSIVFVGLLQSQASESIQWKLLGKILLSWILTLPLSGGLSAALFAIFQPFASVSNVSPNATLVYCYGQCNITST